MNLFQSFFDRHDKLRDSIFNIVRDKNAFKKEIINRTLNLKEGDFFTVKLKTGLFIVIKLYNKAECYPIFENPRIIKVKMQTMNDGEFFFIRTQFDYHLIKKFNGVIETIKLQCV